MKLLSFLFLLCSAVLRLAETIHTDIHPRQVDCSENDLMGLVITEQSWDCGEDGSSHCYQAVTNCSSCHEEGWVEEGLQNYDKNGDLTLSEGVGWDCRTEMCLERPGTSGSLEFPGYEYFDCKECDDEDDCRMPGMKCHLLADDSCSCDRGRCEIYSRSGNAIGVDYPIIWRRLDRQPMVMVAVGPNYVWGVDEDDQIYFRTSSTWIRVDGALKDISVGINTVWGVNNYDDIYMWTSNTGLGKWDKQPGKLKQVSVSGFDDEVVWGVNKDDSIYRWTKNKSWEKVGGSLQMVSCGEAGVWGVNNRNHVYYRTGTYGGRVRAGSGWQMVDNEHLDWISVGGAREVWGGFGNNVYRRSGIRDHNPIGTRWREVVDLGRQGGRNRGRNSVRNMRQVDLHDGIRWGVNSNDEVFYSADESCNSAADCYKAGTLCDVSSDATCICNNRRCKISSGCGTRMNGRFIPCEDCFREECEDMGVCSWRRGMCS